MSTRADRPRGARALRGGLAASTATFVALASHLAGGGQAPALVGIVAPLALSLVVCMAWAGRGLSLARLSASVVASQLLFHLLFVLSAPSGGARAVSHQHGHGAHTQPLLPESSAASAAQTANQATEAAQAGVSMWIWHALAAVVTIVLLHRGELMLLRLRELAGRMAAWLLRRWVVADVAGTFVAPARTLVRAATFLPLHPAPRLTPLLRRGPPAPQAV